MTAIEHRSGDLPDAARRDNTIGALRLIAASLVILSHAPQMLDGDNSREPLHRIFGTMTLGGVAVDIFFLISGYLIAASFASSRSVLSYFGKRIRRIYPAFVVCSLICLCIVAPLAGGRLAEMGLHGWARAMARLVLLKTPEVPGAFAGQHYPSLNGSAWTISYEFRSYILAAAFGLIGLYRRPAAFAGLTAAVLAMNLLVQFAPLALLDRIPHALVAALGEPKQALRLQAAFMVGTCFWLYRAKHDLRGRIALVLAPVMGVAMFLPVLAETALIVMGGYILFWIAFKVSWRPLLDLNARDDISYGVYLYAWPIAALLIWYQPQISLMLLCLFTLTGALACGTLSWFLVERPIMRWRFRPDAVRPAAPAGPST